jgi:WD40 repeat protein
VNWAAAAWEDRVVGLSAMDELHAAALSRDGRRLFLAGSQRGTRLLDVSTGEEVMTFPGHGAASQTFVVSPDSRRLCTAGGKVIKVWDATFLPSKEP